ncbi:hypothetical protein PTT_12570, partial [Pyrenophora teres f. teres 0-1]
EEEEEEEEEEDGDGDHPHCDFKITNTIPEAKYVELFRATNLMIMTGKIQDIHVVDRKHCAFNAATFVQVWYEEHVDEYVVRVPGHATTWHWIEQDAYMLEHEAQLIKHIQKNTSAPVLEVIAYCSNHDNVLGFPYILMTKLPGEIAHTIWEDDSHMSAPGDWGSEHGVDSLYLTADVPHPTVEND